MNAVKFTFAAVLAGVLVLCPMASAQTRRETRPSRSTESSKVEKKERPSAKPAANKPSKRPAVQDNKPSRRPVANPSDKPSGNNTGTGRRPAPGADRPANNRPGDNRPSANRPGDNRPSANRPGDKPGPRPGADFRDPHQPPRVPPHERKPLSYKNPSRFYDHGHHYYGYRVHNLPHHHEVRICWGHRYYLCDGIYYRLHNGHYYVCRPPYGYYFTPSVYAYTPSLCRFAYYSYWNRQYNIINENFRVIEEQNRLIAQNNSLLAEQNAELRAQDAQMSQRSTESYMLAKKLGLIQSYAAVGVDYYYDDGVFFVKNAKGEYETIIPPAGAIIENLPDDYSEVTLSDGENYYLVEDTIYMLVIIEGNAMFEVLGQIQR